MYVLIIYLLYVYKFGYMFILIFFSIIIEYNNEKIIIKIFWFVLRRMWEV